MAEYLAAINAGLAPGTAGGISIFLGALISALGELDDSEDRYLLVGTDANREWLESIRGANQAIVMAPDRPASGLGRALQPVKQYLRPVQQFLERRLNARLRAPAPAVPVSDGFWEGLPAECIHFPNQQYVICDRPTVYNPHDLQHLHLPEYFTYREIKTREARYRAGCERAATVVCASQWVKDDIVHHYGTDPARIQVVPWAAPTYFYPELEPAALASLASRLHLPDRYILYPAVTWPHKNHARLVSALALLRDRHGLNVPLVCTGGPHPGHQGELERHIRGLGLTEQVRFLGFLSSEELRAVYRQCTAVVVPTLFEAASGPMFEAWQEGRPMACSNVTSLPEQAGDAAIVFDPTSEAAIAAAVRALWCDAALAARMAERGRRRLRDFSWSRTARAYRAVYRRAAGRPLNDADRKVLDTDWMRGAPGGADE